jgi:hypothetical protein
MSFMTVGTVVKTFLHSVEIVHIPHEKSFRALFPGD